MVRKKQEQPEISFFNKHKTKISFIFTVLIVSSFIFSLWKIASDNFVEKNKTNNYICQIVGTDVDSGILAMKCVIK